VRSSGEAGEVLDGDCLGTVVAVAAFELGDISACTGSHSRSVGGDGMGAVVGLARGRPVPVLRHRPGATRGVMGGGAAGGRRLWGDLSGES
jgi:hypothetical protein